MRPNGGCEVSSLRIVVIGAGAAGLVAAAEAARRGASVCLLEKNRKTGVKILMSGGTRCNLTHDTDAKGITAAFGAAGRFLQPSVGAFPPPAVVRMFHELGVATKVESTGKIFPQSNRAVQVRDALQRQAIEAGVQIRLDCAVHAVAHDGDQWCIDTPGGVIHGDRLIVTAGGKSWPGCGTTGDAYDWLQRLGHTIITPRPALVPLVGGNDWTRAISGLTLDDCIATVRAAEGKPSRKPLAQRRSSLLFTHFGFSGPAMMDVSGAITAAEATDKIQLQVDLLPEISEAQIQAMLTDRSSGGGRKNVPSVLSGWLPKRLAEAIADQAAVSQTALAELPRGAVRQLIDNLKRLELPITGTRGFAKAEVTAGGVSRQEVDPRTMASRLTENLFIAGEVLDVDGLIGGYNFQAAFSTGRAAGIAAADPTHR
jgi:predicted Rossmann fold flavoprotein